MPSILEHPVLDFLRAPTENSCRLAAGCNEGSRLVKVFVHVLLKSDTGVEYLLLLADLAIGKVCNDLTDQLYYLQPCIEAMRHAQQSNTRVDVQHLIDHRLTILAQAQQSIAKPSLYGNEQYQAMQHF